MRSLVKKIYYIGKNLRLHVIRKYGKFFNRFKKFENSHLFAILCIKKTVYADMAIVNINSLHALNPTHSLYLYCDTMCSEYLTLRRANFDYPEKVFIMDTYGVTTKAWQYYKIEVHIDASLNDRIDTDADSIWYADPIINREKITMLAHAYDFASMPNEVLILKNIFQHEPRFLTFRHCVAAFLSMPSQFLNEKVAEDMRKINDMIFSHEMNFLATEKERGDARRLSEEFAVNLALQKNYPQENLVVLKNKDGWGNKNILQSLYYGCGNKIND